MPTEQELHAALATVIDPELRQPITELGMVEALSQDDAGVVSLRVLLTIAACPLRDTIVDDARQALGAVPGVTGVEIELAVMSDQQRAELRSRLKPSRGIPFAKPDNLTQVYAVVSGKGGVGKSSVTVNLACSLASQGYKVGIIDADIHGFSVPGLMGLLQPAPDGGRVAQQPTRIDDMILPPVAYGVKVISIGMFLDADRPITWRGPLLHRAIEQFLTEVFFGDLDYLFIDLPPGTGDIAISVAQLLPSAELLVVTTPQIAAVDVAQRAGQMATQTGQHIAGVIENMSWLSTPEGRLELFGSGGGEQLAQRLSDSLGRPVPLLGRIPLEQKLREGGDSGRPVVLDPAEYEAAQELRLIAEGLATKPRGISGKPLPFSPKSN